MTHFLYRSQQSATSEFLKDSRGFRKRCGLRRSRSQPSLDRPALTHRIAVTAYIARLLKPSECFTYCAGTSSAGLLTQSTVSTLSTFFKLIDFLLTPRFSITYVCHDVWHGSCLGERCDASNQL